MGRWDKMAEKQRAMIQAEVPEPCVAIGGLQPAGTWGSFGLTKLSPGGGMFKQHQANQAAGDLSARKGVKANRVTFIALTAEKFYAFDVKYGFGGSQKVASKLAEWNRDDVTVELTPGKLSTRVAIDHADGTHSELEASTIGNYNDPLLAALGTMSRS